MARDLTKADTNAMEDIEPNGRNTSSRFQQENLTISTSEALEAPVSGLKVEELIE